MDISRPSSFDDCWTLIVLRYTALLTLTIFLFRRHVVAAIAHELRASLRRIWMREGALTAGDIADLNSRMDPNHNASRTCQERRRRRNKTNKTSTKQCIDNKQQQEIKHNLANLDRPKTKMTAEHNKHEYNHHDEGDGSLESSSCSLPIAAKEVAAAIDLDNDFTIIRSRAATRSKKRCERRDRDIVSKQRNTTSTRRSSSCPRTRSSSEATVLDSESFTNVSTPFSEQTLVCEDEEPIVTTEEAAQGSAMGEAEYVKVKHGDISHLLVGMRDQGLPVGHCRGVSMNLELTEHVESQQRSRSAGSRPLFLWPPS